MYLSTSTEYFPEMYLSTFQVLYKLYLSTDVLKYKVLLPGSGSHPDFLHFTESMFRRQIPLTPGNVLHIDIDLV